MLRHRITRLVVAMTAAVVVAFVLPLGALVKVMAEDQAVAAARDRANNIATIVAGVGEVESLPRVLDPVVDQPPVHTCVSLPNGRVIGPAEDPDDAERVGPLVAQAGSQARSLTVRHDDGADVTVPVLLADGTVVVHSSVHFAAVRRGVLEAWLFLATLTVILVGLSVIVARAIADRIATPVTEMAGVAHRLREGELDARADTSGAHEIAGLGVALNRLAERISELLASEREAAADLSHRLRTPVTALRLDTDLVTDDAVRARLRDHVDDLHRAIDTVVTDARRTSREAMGGQCDLVAVVAERAAFWRPLAEDQGRGMTAALPPGPVLVPLSAHDVQDVVDNLIDNVFAHTPEGAPVRIGVHRDPADGRAVGGAGNSGPTGSLAASVGPAGRVTLVIEDGGPGLGRAELIARGRSGSGSSGLGLAIVARIVESVSGDLVVGPSELGGLAITMQIPVAPML